MKSVVLLFVLVSSVFALRISEIYFGGDRLIPDSERYLELYNDGIVALDLRRVTLVLPRSDTAVVSNRITNGLFILFENEARTNRWLLSPGERAVIITDDYNAGGRLLSWDTNTLLLRPRSKTDWRFSWNNRLHLLGLLHDGVEVFRYPATAVRTIQRRGNALVWKGGDVWREDIPRPGQTKTVRILAERVLPLATMVPITIESEQSLTEVRIESYPDGLHTTHPLSGAPPYHLRLLGGTTHAQTWIIRAGGASHKVRFLDTNLSSPWAGSVFFSELTTDPRLDYSGGGWTGVGGTGAINSSDDWIELANTGSQDVILSNWHIEHITSWGHGYRRIRLRFTSPAGPTTAQVLQARSLGVMSVEDGIASAASIILYDGHPLWGRRVARLSYGDGDVPDGDAESLPVSIQRLPHNAPDEWAMWTRDTPTYGAVNGSGPFLVHGWSTTNDRLLEILMSDPTAHSPQVLLRANNVIDERRVDLDGNMGLFRGRLEVSQERGMSSLQVKNGGRNVLIYTNSHGGRTWEFVWRLAGWLYPHVGEAVEGFVAYPNPVFGGGEVIITGVPVGSTVVIFDEKGYVVKRFFFPAEGYKKWKTPEKRGIYSFLVSFGGRSVYRRLLVR